MDGTIACRSHFPKAIQLESGHTGQEHRQWVSQSTDHMYLHGTEWPWNPHVLLVLLLAGIGMEGGQIVLLDTAHLPDLLGAKPQGHTIVFWLYFVLKG